MRALILEKGGAAAAASPAPPTDAPAAAQRHRYRPAQVSHAEAGQPGGARADPLGAEAGRGVPAAPQRDGTAERAGGGSVVVEEGGGGVVERAGGAHNGVGPRKDSAGTAATATRRGEQFHPAVLSIKKRKEMCHAIELDLDFG